MATTSRTAAGISPLPEVVVVSDEDFSLGTFARFYEFVVENVDARARPVVHEGSQAGDNQ
jgi:hypothetical protein